MIVTSVKKKLKPYTLIDGADIVQLAVHEVGGGGDYFLLNGAEVRGMEDENDNAACLLDHLPYLE